MAAAKQKGASVDSVRQITFAAPVFVQAAGASEPVLSGAVAAAKQGQVSSVVKGNGGAYIFQVLAKKQREGVKFDAKQQAQQMQQQAQQMVGRMAMNELYLNANVVDKRYLFF
jgi:peptidyl-prolyl cis-trans isomerase D